ncbi:hypothetical protein CGCA056_v006481 [Colletotrichum aenigma]|uniref:uncharacterized protein n=1 Tax=Colletotrichum aenigma TaxID=1215731 RepID=UPI001872460F|nr:uncharacterized protein CGCA056_v006481 [Colletotrichum aenigma]KAF5522662.1 hypothetical protein CGCA056_v006481 [Colletotrichum aenigma]
MASPEVSLKRKASDLDQSVEQIKVDRNKVDSSTKTMGPFLKETRMFSKVMTTYAGPNKTKSTVHKQLLLPDNLARYEKIHPPEDVEVVEHS